MFNTGDGEDEERLTNLECAALKVVRLHDGIYRHTEELGDVAEGVSLTNDIHADAVGVCTVLLYIADGTGWAILGEEGGAPDNSDVASTLSWVRIGVESCLQEGHGLDGDRSYGHLNGLGSIEK